ncbi:unnamed protein product [Lepidochelys olivacea]
MELWGSNSIVMWIWSMMSLSTEIQTTDDSIYGRDSSDNNVLYEFQRNLREAFTLRNLDGKPLRRPQETQEHPSERQKF